MSITIDQITHARQLFNDKAWEQLDNLISVAEAKKGTFPIVSHFKVMAMANIPTRRQTDEFLDLLQARMIHLEHKPLYLTILVDTQMEMQHFADAVDTLQQLQTLYPDSPKLFEQMALCARHSAQPELFEYAQGRFELSVGKELSRRFRFEEAVPYLKAANERTQADPRSRWLLGQALVLTGEYDTAQECLTQHPHGAESQQDMILLRLELALKQKDLTTASSIAEALIEQNAGHIEALRALALVREWKGDLLGAVATYHTITQRYPFDIQASLKAIHIAHHLAESQVGSLTPFTDQQRLTIACVLIDAGYEEAGINMLKGVKRRSPQFEQARLLEIDQIIKRKRYEHALELLDYELKSAPENDEFLTRAAQCHCLLGNYKRAENIANKAADINWNNHRNLFWLAESQYQQCANGTSMTTDQLNTVIVLYNSYSQHYLHDGFPLLRIADIHYIMKQYHLIHDCITEARLRGHVSPRAAYLMGKYWQDADKRTEALREFNDAIDLNGTGEFFWAHYERAKVALQDRNLSLAMQDAKHLLSLWPEDEDALALMKTVRKAALKNR